MFGHLGSRDGRNAEVNSAASEPLLTFTSQSSSFAAANQARESFDSDSSEHCNSPSLNRQSNDSIATDSIKLRGSDVLRGNCGLMMEGAGVSDREYAHHAEAAWNTGKTYVPRGSSTVEFMARVLY